MRVFFLLLFKYNIREEEEGRKVHFALIVLPLDVSVTQVHVRNKIFLFRSNIEKKEENGDQ
jgi:hypothetical protein